MAALRSSSSSTMSRSLSRARAISTMPTAPSTIRDRADTTALAIGVDPALLHRVFAHVTRVAVYRNGLNVADDEEGTPVFLASGMRTSWAAAWPAFRHFS